MPELRHYFGIDLRDIFSEVAPLSPRYVLAHVRYLPLESAFVAAQRGGDRFRGWDEGRYMTATLINTIKTLIYITTLANSDPKKHHRITPPEVYPIPDRKAKKERDARPGSFAHIVKTKAAAIRKKREGRNG